MAIGEFGGAPAAPAGGILASTPIYWFYEMTHAALNPARAWADAVRLSLKNPVNPLYHTTFGKSIGAAAELFERSTRRYGQPAMANPVHAGWRRTRAGDTSRVRGSGRSAGCSVSSALSSITRVGRSRGC